MSFWTDKTKVELYGHNTQCHTTANSAQTYPLSSTVMEGLIVETGPGHCTVCQSVMISALSKNVLQSNLRTPLNVNTWPKQGHETGHSFNRTTSKTKNEGVVNAPSKSISELI